MIIVGTGDYSGKRNCCIVSGFMDHTRTTVLVVGCYNAKSACGFTNCFAEKRPRHCRYIAKLFTAITALKPDKSNDGFP